MKKCRFLILSVFVSVFLIFLIVPSSQAQTKGETDFKKLHDKEMTPFIENCKKCHTIKVELRDKEIKKTFLEKCSQCHIWGRVFSKKRSVEEWDKVLKVMAGKPHANLSEKELKKVQEWINLMQLLSNMGS